MAIMLGEARGAACQAAIKSDDQVLMSAGTLAEALIVGLGHDIYRDVLDSIDTLHIEVIDLTPASARRVGDAYRRWGKGMHPANLNFGDCFAYELAERYACPLLYVGNDFAKTDVTSAL